MGYLQLFTCIHLVENGQYWGIWEHSETILGCPERCSGQYSYRCRDDELVQIDGVCSFPSNMGKCGHDRCVGQVFGWCRRIQLCSKIAQRYSGQARRMLKIGSKVEEEIVSPITSVQKYFITQIDDLGSEGWLLNCVGFDKIFHQACQTSAETRISV